MAAESIVFEGVAGSTDSTTDGCTCGRGVDVDECTVEGDGRNGRAAAGRGAERDAEAGTGVGAGGRGRCNSWMVAGNRDSLIGSRSYQKSPQAS